MPPHPSRVAIAFLRTHYQPDHSKSDGYGPAHCIFADTKHLGIIVTISSTYTYYEPGVLLLIRNIVHLLAVTTLKPTMSG